MDERVHIRDRLSEGAGRFADRRPPPARRCCLNCRWWTAGRAMDDDGKRCRCKASGRYGGTTAARAVCECWRLWSPRYESQGAGDD
ncbi:MAG: hypothetical protein QM570_15445 [Planctomycetota bacterium]|nr:hypothetical protein [Planctomycetota bacterium]